MSAKAKNKSMPSKAPEQGSHPSAADRLCGVATDLFYRRGIRAVGVDEIVHETGVTKPTLYRSYESKDALISVCLVKSIEEKRQQLDAIEARFSHDPLAQIRAITQTFADDIAEPEYRGCAVTNAAVEFPEQGHPVREIVENCKAELRSRLSALTSRLGISEPDLLADSLVLLIEGASTCRHTSGSQGPASALMKATNALLESFLRP